MTDFLVGIGVMLAIEGTLYALLAGRMKAALKQMDAVPEGTIRLFGVGALALGVGIVWLVRG